MAEKMMIKKREDWDKVLSLGAEVLYSTKNCKIFRMPDGSLWRALAKYRMAWPVDTYFYMRFIHGSDSMESTDGPSAADGAPA
jgi:hypothetical protein